LSLASGSHYQAHSGLSPPSYRPCRAHSASACIGINPNANTKASNSIVSLDIGDDALVFDARLPGNLAMIRIISLFYPFLYCYSSN
jgi:hypothetical protein